MTKRNGPRTPARATAAWAIVAWAIVAPARAQEAPEAAIPEDYDERRVTRLSFEEVPGPPDPFSYERDLLGSVFGIVTSAEDGKPIPDAEVWIDRDAVRGGFGQEEADKFGRFKLRTSDSGGMYFLPRLAFGEDIRLYATAQGRLPAIVQVTLDAERPQRMVNVVMKRGGAVRGVYTENGLPAEKVVVRLSLTDGRTITPPRADWPARPYRLSGTGELGEFAFNELPEGIYNIDVFRTVDEGVLRYVGLDYGIRVREGSIADANLKPPGETGNLSIARPIESPNKLFPPVVVIARTGDLMSVCGGPFASTDERMERFYRESLYTVSLKEHENLVIENLPFGTYWTYVIFNVPINMGSRRDTVFVLGAETPVVAGGTSNLVFEGPSWTMPPTAGLKLLAALNTPIRFSSEDSALWEVARSLSQAFEGIRIETDDSVRYLKCRIPEVEAPMWNILVGITSSMGLDLRIAGDTAVLIPGS